MKNNTNKYVRRALAFILVWMCSGITMYGLLRQTIEQDFEKYNYNIFVPDMTWEESSEYDLEGLVKLIAKRFE